MIDASDSIADQWSKKDFVSPGRWIEVRLPRPRAIREIVAITSPYSRFELRIPDGPAWQTLAARTTEDRVRRHYREASATTRAVLPAREVDRFRLVFTDKKKPGDPQDVIFELMAR